MRLMDVVIPERTSIPSSRKSGRYDRNSSQPLQKTGYSPTHSTCLGVFLVATQKDPMTAVDILEP